jgi:hypothetical protein
VDKRGRVVENLSAADFELRIDSKLQSLAFFEQVRAGSGDEEQQLNAAGKGDAKFVKTPTAAGDRERVVKEVARVGVVIYSLDTPANSLGPGTPELQNTSSPSPHIWRQKATFLPLRRKVNTVAGGTRSWPSKPYT